METLINCLCGMKRKAHGAQKPRHINKIVEAASAAQRSDSPAQAINQGFLKVYKFYFLIAALFPILGTAHDVRAEDAQLPKGTQITLRLNDTLSTASNMEGDEFTAVVVLPVYLGDRIVVPKGSVITGSVSRILRPDRLKGKAVMDLMFQSIRVEGYRQTNIVAALTRVDATESGGMHTADNFAEREKPAESAAKSGNPKIGVRAQFPDGKKANIGASGGLPSVFNSQGDDAGIPRGALMDITLDRSLILIKETEKPTRK